MNDLRLQDNAIEDRSHYQKQLLDVEIPRDAEFVKQFDKPKVNHNSLVLKRCLKVAIITTTSGSVESTKLWIKYHSAIGVSSFYLFTNGQADHAAAKKELSKWEGVKVFGNSYKLDYMKAHSRAWNETWLAGFFNKPCNHELFVMQTLNMEVGLQQAIKDGIEWIIHLDTDELFYPGNTQDYNIQQYFASVAHSVNGFERAFQNLLFRWIPSFFQIMKRYRSIRMSKSLFWKLLCLKETLHMSVRICISKTMKPFPKEIRITLWLMETANLRPE